MKASPNKLTVSEVLELKAKEMLVPNPEYQRGAVWTPTQKKKLVDSVLRGYPIPLIYFHHIKETVGKMVKERYEIIDGQQRINALSDFVAGALKLFHPIDDASEARFPDFIKRQSCLWAGKKFPDLTAELQQQLLDTPLQIVEIEISDPNEARDLFVRLQAGMPLNSQEKRDAWPGKFPEFVLRLVGKSGIEKYQGHDFFKLLMPRSGVDRGKLRQLAAQLAMLFLAHRENGSFRRINAGAIDDFYYENLGFDPDASDAQRLVAVLAKLAYLLRDHKGPKVLGHEAIHLVLLVDTLLDDYTPSWESKLASGFGQFRENVVQARRTRYEAAPGEYWSKYNVHTGVNSHDPDVIQRRHEFFVKKNARQFEPADEGQTAGVWCS